MKHASPLPSLIVTKHADLYDPSIRCLLMVAVACLVLWGISAHVTKMTAAAVTSYHHSYLGPHPQSTFFVSVYAQWIMLLLEFAVLVEAVVYQKALNL